MNVPARIEAAQGARGRILGIEMLRGIAVSFTVFAHLPLTSDAFPPFGLRSPWIVGVPIFYVISGWIIAHVTRTYSGGDMAAFLTRRLFRVGPTMLVTLMITLLFSATLTHEGFFKPVIDQFYPPLQDTVGVVSSNLLFIADIAPWYGVVVPQSLSGLWSISIEMRFYLLIALLLFLPFRTRTAALGIISLAIFVDRAMAATTTNSFMPYNHAYFLELFGLGSVSYLWRDRFVPNRFVLAVCWVIVMAFGCFDIRKAGFLLGYVAFAAAVVYIVNCMSNMRLSGDTRSGRTLLWLGARSYTIYVLHFQFLAFAGLFAQTNATIFIVKVYSLILIAGLLVGIPIVELVYRTVERRGNLLGHSIALSTISRPAGKPAGT